MEIVGMRHIHREEPAFCQSKQPSYVGGYRGDENHFPASQVPLLIATQPRSPPATAAAGVI
jgi:hypothetical protein